MEPVLKQITLIASLMAQVSIQMEQVPKQGRDLRQQKMQKADSRRRSRQYFGTCAIETKTCAVHPGTCAIRMQ